MPTEERPPIERKDASRRKATITTLIGGTAGTLIVTVQAAVLIPLYINHIGPRLYGAWLASGDACWSGCRRSTWAFQIS